MTQAHNRTILATVLLVLCSVAYCHTASAVKYTAVVSGNFNAPATWGGAVPPSSISADTVVIPSGIAVRLDVDQSFSGTSMLDVDGILNSGPNKTALILTGGTFGGNGNVYLDSLVIGTALMYPTKTFFTVQAIKLTSYGNVLPTATTIYVFQRLLLLAGVTSVSAAFNTLNIMYATIDVAGGTLNASSNFIGSFPYRVHYTVAPVTTGVELTGSGLKGVTVDVPGTVTLSNDLDVDSLQLLSGSLALDGHRLKVDTQMVVTATGAISSTSAASVYIHAPAGVTGALRWASGKDTVGDLILNTGNTVNNIATVVKVSDSLTLISGKVQVTGGDLYMLQGARSVGLSANSYIITSGSSTFVRYMGAAGADTFQVGTMAHYAPIVVTAAAATGGAYVAVQVAQGIMMNGMPITTEPSVNATWTVLRLGAPAQYNVQPMWDAGMEINGFNRNYAFISSFDGTKWDWQPYGAATASGSLYSMVRTNASLPGMFAVIDTSSRLAVNVAKVNGTRTALYPQPVLDVLHMDSDRRIDRVVLLDMTGRVGLTPVVTNNTVNIIALQPGSYVLHIYADDMQETKRIIKQ